MKNFLYQFLSLYETQSGKFIYTTNNLLFYVAKARKTMFALYDDKKFQHLVVFRYNAAYFLSWLCI